MTMLKILCKLVSKQQSNSMLKKVKSLMRNASSYPLSNLCCALFLVPNEIVLLWWCHNKALTLQHKNYGKTNNNTKLGL